MNLSSDGNRNRTKAPADFDRRIEILDENGVAVQIDEDMLLEAMADFTQFLPRD
jgi:hypothetical protein